MHEDFILFFLSDFWKVLSQNIYQKDLKHFSTKRRDIVPNFCEFLKFFLPDF